MPEKLLNVSSKPAFPISAKGNGPSITHPELALLAMSIMSDWSLLEGAMSSLFVNMLGANPIPGTAMYASLTSTAAQKSALRAVATASLSTNRQDVFEAILTHFGSVAKERNKIAHWLWGTSPDIPDAVLLTNPSSLTEYTAQMFDHLHEGREPRFTFPEEEIYVWRKQDFLEVTRRLHQVMEYIRLFDIAISPPRQFSVDSNEQALRKLQLEPEIRQALLRQQKRQKKN